MTDTDNLQQSLGLDATEKPLERVEEYRFDPPPKPIRGYPLLHWHGKRPFTSTRYFPAQHKETYGQEVDKWRNKIYWGDNLQVMSHLLKEYRGQVKLVYIDPPFDSKAEYKKQVSVRNQSITNDNTAFEEKQYSDIWTNDYYLQFMYERLILIRELLSDDGCIYLHCDFHKSHYLRCILDEIFGENNFVNEIVWKRKGGSANPSNRYGVVTDTIYLYAKSNAFNLTPIRTRDTEEAQKYIAERFTKQDEHGTFMLAPIERNAALGMRENLRYEYKGYIPQYGWMMSRERLEKLDAAHRLFWNSNDRPNRKVYLEDYPGQPIENLWTDIFVINPMARERLDYPTQKPEKLIERILLASSKVGDLVFDCFMGSGTTQAVAMRTSRRFIGADINLGAIQVTTKRLLSVIDALKNTQLELSFANDSIELGDEDEVITEKGTSTYYTGFEVYNVNHYDVFRNPDDARDLLIQALEVNPLEKSHLFDGEKDGRLVKIMPVNRIATREDLNPLLSNMDYRAFERRYAEHPNRPVEKITLVCMGHEPGLGAYLREQVSPYILDVEVVDILRDKQELQFKRDSEAKIVVRDGKLVIEKFYPMNLLSKLSLQAEKVEDWRELVESVMIDWNYDGAVLQPVVVDIPDKNELVSGEYPIPDDAGTIRIKITDLLSESLEQEVQYG